jgi:hypothetical protein
VSAPTAPRTVESRTADRQRALVAAILLASFLLYAPSLANGFTWDDRFAAMGSGPTRQPLVATLHPLGDYWANNWWPQHAPAATAYRPLTTLWFALRHAVCGDHALVAHALNLALHTLATGLVHLLLRRLGLPFAAAAIGSAVFGLHALHSEVVANLVGGAELLALVFGLAATLLMLRVANAASTLRASGWLLASGASLFLAASAKESGLAWVAFAPLCVLARGWQRARERAGTAPLARVSPKCWLLVATTCTIAAGCHLQLRAGMLARLPHGGDDTVGLLDNPLLLLPLLQRIASGFLAWGHGLLLTLWPHELCCDYGPDRLPVVRDLASALGLAGFAVGAAFVFGLGVALRHARRHPLPALATAAFVGFSVLVSNVPMAVYMHFAERSYTTPSLGLALAAGVLATQLPTARARRVGLAALAVWLCSSIAVAVPRNFVWADDATLITSEVANSPDSVRLQLCAGELHRQRGDLAAAERHFTRAAELAPWLPQPWFELARDALRRGDLAKTRELVVRAAATHPQEVARYAAAIASLRAQLDAAPAAAPR